jgi:DMSO/TMAO reductase YedYZ molybdopterin-dependent catalytic subunit
MANVPAGKSRNLVRLPDDDLNFGTPLSLLRGSVVPNDQFFVRSSYTPPTITADAWRVQVTGLVERPREVSLADLKQLSVRTQECWLECAGNSRSRFAPEAEGNQWGHHAVGNAAFTGVPLHQAIDLAGGVKSNAVEIVLTGADDDRFQRSLPRAEAMRPDVMLVWAMNGEPIPSANGGPVRLIVPRWAGIASVKWPKRIEAVDRPFEGYYQTERYIVYDAEQRPLRPVREMPVKSVIAAPEAETRLRHGAPVKVFGFAWSGFGDIARVEFSADAGHRWQQAQLLRPKSPNAWTRWEFEWTPTAIGPAQLASRAHDDQGNVQPNQVAWNYFGYEMNAVEIVLIDVV